MLSYGVLWTGVLMMGVLNLLVDAVLLALTWLVPTNISNEFLSTWLVLLCLTNILLVLGIKADNKVRARIFKQSKEPKTQFRGINFTSLCSLAGRYDNPIPTRFLALIDCLKIPELIPKIRNKHSQKRNCTATVPVWRCLE